MTDANWQAITRSWTISLWVVVWLLLVGALYLRGWLVLRSRSGRLPSRFGPERLLAFEGGLLTIFLAIQSPLDSLSSFSLVAHMIQHLLLILVAPVLLLLGQPMIPMIAGLPRGFRRDWFQPFANWRPLRRTISCLLHPRVCLAVFVVTLWGWHVPLAYEQALQSEAWHRAEHVCFLLASLWFWFPVVRPYPMVARWSTWLLLPYLFVAGIQGTALSAMLTFADEVVYSHYQQVPNLLGLPPLVDQSLAGGVMWVPTSIALLIALVLVVGELFSTQQRPRHSRQTVKGLNRKPVDSPTAGSALLPVVAQTDCVRPWTMAWLLGAFVRPLRVRRACQLLTLGLTACVVADGLAGPQVSPLNLAGVVPWIHWRAFLVLSLLVGGNFFCMVCPFTTLSRLVRKCGVNVRLRGGRRLRWPLALQNKWPAIGLTLIFFWAYEAFALWDRPAATAWIAIGFLSSAVLLSLIFRDAPFCKFVCPIGQFNFVQSLFSPTEVAAVSSAACANCSTRDCIAGNARSPGCQLNLFLPRKAGNMDCTFCLDCADACPHDNVQLVTLGRTDDLSEDRARSGVGRYSDRFDLAVLIGLLFVAALVNAAWMTAPWLKLEDRAVEFFAMGRLPTMSIGMLVVLCVVPSIVYCATTKFSHAAQGISKQASPKDSDQIAPDASQPETLRQHFAGRVLVLVPLGLGMWLAHYTFHLATSWDSVIVASRRAISQLAGWPYEVTAAECACCRAETIGWLLPLEFCFVAIGLCGSLVVLHRVTRRTVPDGRHQIFAMLPWVVLLSLYYACCLWTLLQPMQMRGVAG